LLLLLLLILPGAVSCSTDLGPVATPSHSGPSSASSPGPATPSSPAPQESQAQTTVPKPPIVSKPIPFPPHREEETAAYSKRHYEMDTFRLRNPRAVVEHFTATDTFQVVWNTFASDQPDLGELPGTCAHFVIDTDGTIFQLVPLDIMCRHASGMNYTAVGIEMVGQSDAEILGNPRQLNAALSLTLWLMDRFGIELRNVIGHNENLTSPLRIEKVGSFKCQTHGDWTHDDMEVFRSKLKALAATYDVPVGPAATPVDIGC
jgi:beta-N-acetylhexosaminidase